MLKRLICRFYGHDWSGLIGRVIDDGSILGAHEISRFCHRCGSAQMRIESWKDIEDYGLVR